MIDRLSDGARFVVPGEAGDAVQRPHRSAHERPAQAGIQHRSEIEAGELVADFSDSSFYQSEAEITAQASMTDHLALKLGYLIKYANSPPLGFEKTDNTATASIVFRWKAATPAPAP